VIDAYHQLWHVEKSFRMSNHDLRARPIYHLLTAEDRLPSDLRDALAAIT
jgi:hypothetical protein